MLAVYLILNLRKVTKQEIEAMKTWKLEVEKHYTGTLVTATQVSMEAIQAVNELKNFDVVQRVPIQFLNSFNNGMDNLKIRQI